MRISSLTEAYHEARARDNLDHYPDCHPELFTHYRNYWGVGDKPWADLDRAATIAREEMITERLRALEERFAAFELDTADLEVILLVGQETSNGHAIRLDDKFAVWLPIETYPTEIRVDVFATHEIIHAIHYQRQPAFYFENDTEFRSTSRRLLTEGLATYFSRELLGIDDATALWADYLDENEAVEWMTACHDRDEELRQIIRDRFDGTDHDLDLFHAAEPGDPLRFRGAYFVGLKAIDELAALRAGDPTGLLSIPRPDLEHLIKPHL
jgi:uncharacterized protein YjaZ